MKRSPTDKRQPIESEVVKKAASQIHDSMDELFQQIYWLQAVAQLIQSQGELSEMHDTVYLSKETIGATGHLIGHLVDAIDKAATDAFNLMVIIKEG